MTPTSSAATADAGTVYHVRITSGLMGHRRTTMLNLDEAALFEKVIEPWRGGLVLISDEAYVPAKSDLKIFRGPRVQPRRFRAGEVLRSARLVTSEMLVKPSPHTEPGTAQSKAGEDVRSVRLFFEDLTILITLAGAVVTIAKRGLAGVVLSIAAVLALVVVRVVRMRLRNAGRAIRWAGIVISTVIIVAFGIVALLTSAGSSAGRWIDEHVLARSSPPAPRVHGVTLADILADAAADNDDVVVNETVPLRPGKPPSLLTVFRDRDPSHSRSDELRVYDPVGKADDEYTLRLQFRPQADAEYRPVPKESVLQPLVFAIRLGAPAELDGSPGDDIVFDLSEFGKGPAWPRPMYLTWDARDVAYRVKALLSPASTKLTSMARFITHRYLRPGDFAKGKIEGVYDRAAVIKDQAGNVNPFEAFAVETYIDTPELIPDSRGSAPGGLALTVGYVVREPSLLTPHLLQAVTWHVDLRGAMPRASALFDPPVVLKVGRRVSNLDDVLRTAAP